MYEGRPSQKFVDDCVYYGFNVWCCARGTVERVRRRCGGVVPAVLLAARAELDGVVVGDVAVSPQVQARASSVFLSRTVLRH